ncbi:DUF2087 domain-containing protein [Micromonospora sp. DT47]|uniref:DUF2087 domain-containing protein n=1 Tax=Micromonospora sp. DT47 TaxID=3393431 RepID=UPI003CE81739
MTAHALAAALADDRRRRVFAAIALGDTDLAAVVARTGLSTREAATAVRKLAEGQVVTDGGDGLRIDAERLREFARVRVAGPAGPAPDPRAAVLRTFVRDRTLLRLPAQRSRCRIVLEHIAQTSFAPGERRPEREVDDVLRSWCDGGEADHVTLRRY